MNTLANPHRTRLTALPTDLVTRLATVPGLVRPGISHWDLKTRLPLHPLANENAYGDPQLLRDLAAPGAAFAQRLGADVIVGAETGGIPLATAIALTADLPFAFVRKPGYVGHEDHERQVLGASVTGRRVLLVDDAISSGKAIEAFAAELQTEGAILTGVFTLIDMRDVAPTVAPITQTLPIESVATYLEVLATATDHGILTPAIHRLAVDALTHHWPDTDPRWPLLEQAA
jgi:orotate phosphoribosyltransferase